MATQMPPATQSQESGGSTADQAKDKAQEVAGQAKEQVSNVTQQASSRVREQVDQRSTQFGEQVTTQAQDARTVAEELRKQGKDQPAKLAEQAADKAEQLGSYLQRADADALLRDVEDFGRRKPWAVAAGGLALGFAASRFLKASSQQRAQGASRPTGSTPTAHAPNGAGTFQPPAPPVQSPAADLSGGVTPATPPTMPDAGRGMPGTTGGF